MVFETRATSGRKFNLWRAFPATSRVTTCSNSNTPLTLTPHANTKLRQDNVTLVIEASSHRPFTPRGMRAPSPPSLPLTRVSAGHIVVAVSLAALGPTQMSSFFSLFIFFLLISTAPATSPQPHPLPLDPDPATSTCPRHPGSTDPATTKTPPRRRHLDTVATATSLRRFHRRRPPRPRCTGAVSTRPPPPPRLPSPPTSFTRPLLIGAISKRHTTGTAVVQHTRHRGGVWGPTRWFGVGTKLENLSVAQIVISTAPHESQTLAFNYASLALGNSFFLHHLKPPTAPARNHESALTGKPLSHERTHTHTLASVIAAQLGSLADLKTYVAAAAQGTNSGGGAGGFVWLVTDALGRLGVVATYGAGTLLVAERRQSLLASDGTELGGVYQPGTPPPPPSSGRTQNAAPAQARALSTSARASGSVRPTNVWSDRPLAPSDAGAVDGSDGMYGASEAPHPTRPHRHPTQPATPARPPLPPRGCTYPHPTCIINCSPIIIYICINPVLSVQSLCEKQII
ncbi:hypothetical protein EDB84DRAFT_1680578 [Lactarius hengduanensis]|nr:hypothetical protein EDB84DRAFT_1680578 [Lactarius hengduanensis]